MSIFPFPPIKNLFQITIISVGGLEAINLSHFIGAVYGMENMMGRYVPLLGTEHLLFY